jgi:hypothetical protein
MRDFRPLDNLMLRAAFFLFCLLTVTAPLRANLGETVEQCVARYGRPVGYSEANAKLPFGTVAFTAADYTLVVFVMKNKEVGARVSKADHSAFTDVERQNIMNADSLAGSPWTTAASDDPATLRWTRADKATALYDKDKHVLIFTSDEMAAAMHSVQPASTPNPGPAQATASTPAPPLSAPAAPAPPTPWPSSAPASVPPATNSP